MLLFVLVIGVSNWLYQICLIKLTSMKHRFKQLISVVFALLTFSFSHAGEEHPPKPSNKVVLEWNRHAFKALGGAEHQHSLQAACVYAMMHAAIHDAVNAADPHYQTYAYHRQHRGANSEVAAASAAYHVLKTVLPSSSAYLDSVFFRLSIWCAAGR